MKKKFNIGMDVVTAARERIRNVFRNGVPVVLSFSGGKDSLCLEHLVYTMCETGEIDKSLLKVIFIDEEAIYPCVEKTVLEHRVKWLMAGVPFEWYAMEYKHYNCLNSLSNDETFVCFDSAKADRWVRNPPPFAITDHPLLIKRKDNYQSWCMKAFKNYAMLIALRAAESIQRMHALSTKTNEDNKFYPIYDWTDEDVWKYIYDNNIEFPDAYLYMWQCGKARNKLRISQFFSIDTIGSLVDMCQYYPSLFDKISAREPNAYLAMLYWDSEMFRRKKEKNSEHIDYKERVVDMFENPAKNSIDMGKSENKRLKSLIVQKLHYMDKQSWKSAYEMLYAGDPKGRAYRALSARLKKNEGEDGKHDGKFVATRV